MALRVGDRRKGKKKVGRGREGEDVDSDAKWLPNCLNRKPVGGGGVEP